MEPVLQPYLIIQSDSLKVKPRPLVDAREKEGERNSINSFTLDFDPTIILFINPCFASDFGEQICMRLRGMEVFSWSGFDHPHVTSIQCFFAHNAKIVSIDDVVKIRPLFITLLLF